MRRAAALIAAAGVLWAGAAEAAAPPSPGMAAAFDKSQQAYQLQRLKESADAGDAKAQVRLGDLYRAGRPGLQPNPVLACDQWQKAASAVPRAAHDLAQCFYDGVGRAQDYAAARAWYEKAVALEFVPSKCALGDMLVRGLGGPKDAPRGLDLCKLGAQAGDANAEADMGDYAMGAGGVMAPNMLEAKGWYQKAALKGQANAAFNLAALYWNGEGGVEADHDQAVRWWRFAYDHGRVDAAKYLGDSAYLRYRDVGAAGAPLLDEAIDWYQKAAAAARDPDARAAALDALASARAIRDGPAARKGGGGSP
jgi:TPR repeat protein